MTSIMYCSYYIGANPPDTPHTPHTLQTRMPAPTVYPVYPVRAGVHSGMRAQWSNAAVRQLQGFRGASRDRETTQAQGVSAVCLSNDENVTTESHIKERKH